MTGPVRALDASWSSRLAGVDVMRGLCVLLVVIHHVNLRFVLNHYPVGDLVPAWPGRVLFWSGYYAVIVFFVISGFLITSLSLRRWGTLGGTQPGAFYRMRFARIAPCLALLLVILSALHAAAVPDFTLRPDRSSLGRALLAALTFHVNWLEGHRGYLPGGWDVLWSLSVEEVFYLAFSLLAVCLRSEKLILVPLGALVILGPISRTLLGGEDPWGDYAYLSCMDGIAFGCLAALACSRLSLRRGLLRGALFVGMGISTLVIVLSQKGVLVGMSRVGLDVTALEIGTALMLLAFGCGVGNATAASGTRWLRVVGRCSYEVYLFHMLVVLGLMAVVRHRYEFTTLSSESAWEWYGVMLLLSILLGYVVARVYSEPLNRWIRAQVMPAGQ